MKHDFKIKIINSQQNKNKECTGWASINIIVIMDHHSTRLDRRQILATILICCMSLLTAMCSFSTIFTASHPNLECEEHQNVPVKVNTSFCEQILSNGSNNGSCRFNYHFGETIITEWKLVCDDRKYLSNYLQTSYMCGSLFSIIFGYFSDRNGRKKTLIVLLMLIALLKMANQFVVWSPWVNLTVTRKYAVYLVSEFFTGLFVNGITSVSYVLLYELSPARYIISMSNLNMYAYVLGELVLLVISYFSRNWHPINWFIAVYALVIAVLSVLRLPESKMYLMMNQTDKKPKEDLNLGNDENSKRLLTSDSPGAKRDVPSRIEDRSVIKYMFKSKETIVKILIISYVWFSLPLVYLGISLGKLYKLKYRNNIRLQPGRWLPIADNVHLSSLVVNDSVIEEVVTLVTVSLLICEAWPCLR